MLKRYFALTLVVIAATSSALLAVDRAPAISRSAAVQSLHETTGNTAHIVLDGTTGAARVLSLAPGSLELPGETAEQRTRSFFDRHGPVFGVEDSRGLSLSRHIPDRFGGEHLSYTQLYRGVEVYGSEMRAHYDRNGQLVAVNGRLVPDIRLNSIEPNVDSETAENIARNAVAKQKESWAIEATADQLYVFRAGLLTGRAGSDHLVWMVEVGNGRDIQEFVFVDSHSGFVIAQFTGIEHLHRRMFHERSSNQIWDEGDPLPFEGIDESADIEVNQLIDFAEDAYQFYANISGGTFLSYNGNDAMMRTVYDDVDLGCPNAWWRGGSQITGFCPGTTSDDVVAHEWTHAYTDFTHDLIYWSQPGALNESYSDIFGEVVDEINGVGNDTPELLRVDGECSDVMAANRPRLIIESPPEVAGEYDTGGADFNPLPPYSVTAQVELVDDGSDDPTNGCGEFIDFTPGNIAIVEFGTACHFKIPAEQAQAAGAAGVIYVNARNDNVVDMPGSGARLTIPSVWIGLTDGQGIIDTLDLGVTATVTAGGHGSVRWVVGEDTLWSGLRDMWHPNCAGDPGKVSDSQYVCGSDDNMGVHTNSGVPNHAFALIVDGGTYNGHTVAGIGMTKAAHIYWRAMSVYQTIGTDFLEHAEVIELSCQDLSGLNLEDLVTGGASGEIIDSGDCEQVAEAMAAVEMRNPPTQCRFDMVLQPGAPEYLRFSTELFSETFDSDPIPQWSVSNQGAVIEDWIPRDWVWTTDVPAGGDGGALFATNDDMGGNCTSNDQSGVLHLDSPAITLPEGQIPILLFDHYAATEPASDGGNVRISVNGGPYQLVPTEAFLFNPYNDVLLGPAVCNNPCAGEPAFSGTNEGSYYRSSWGQSQIDLSAVAQPGDTIRLRFNFGVDGCSGIDGWYLDNVRIIAAPGVIRGGDRVQP